MAIGSEQVVLAGLLQRPEQWSEIADIVKPAHFHREIHATTFRAIGAMIAAGEPVDVLTVADRLIAAGLSEDINNGAYLTGLANDVVSANAIGHARILRDEATRRRAREIGSQLAEGPGTSEAVDAAIRALMELTQGLTRHDYHISEGMALAVDELVEMMESGRTLRGITTGLERLDFHLGGLQETDLVVIGARPSMGKTSILLGMALTAALRGGHDGKGVPVGLISAEQPLIQVAQRHQAAEARVALEAMRRGRVNDADAEKLTRIARSIGRARYWVYDRTSPTIDEVIRQARKWHQRHGIRALYLDYLQKIRGHGDSRAYQVEDVASGLKNLARELKIPVVALAQVNRSVEGRPDKRPRMSDLKDSGAIEQEADQILTLYRDEVYDENSEHKGVAEIEICKNRHGYTGTERVAWQGQFVRFADLEQRYNQVNEYHAKGAVV